MLIGLGELDDALGAIATIAAVLGPLIERAGVYDDEQTTAEQEMRVTLYNQLAEREGFVVLYPDVDALGRRLVQG